MNSVYPHFLEIGKLKGSIPLLQIPDEFFSGFDPNLGVPLMDQDHAKAIHVSAKNEYFLPPNPKRSKITRPYCPAADITWGSIALNPDNFNNKFFAAEIPIADYHYDKNNFLTLSSPEKAKVLIKYTGEVMSSLLMRSNRLMIGSPLICFGINYKNGIGYHFNNSYNAFAQSAVCPIRDFNWNSNSELPNKRDQIFDLFQNTPIILKTTYNG